MQKQFDIIRKTRTHLLNFISDLSLDELNKIPEGFNNNIVWHLGHLVAAQQGVCYKRGGTSMRIDDTFFSAYKPDSKPEHFVGAEELEKIKSLLVSTIDQFEADMMNNAFANYQPWTTRYGVSIEGIDDALTFLIFHEGLHLGYIMAQKRLVRMAVH